MGSRKKGGELNNSTKDNPYDNYHGHQSSSQNLENSQGNTSKDSGNSSGKDPKNKKQKNR